MHLKRTIALMALSGGLVAAGPAAAQPGGHDPGREGATARGGGKVPSRVAKRAKRAERALDRASAAADDGNDGAASAALGAVGRNLAAAVRAANRRVTAGADTGPASAGAVARAQDDVITEVSGLFDGADALVGDLDDALNAAIDGRDGLVAAIAALSPDDQAAYARVLERIESDLEDEIDGIDEALSDDTLTSEAEADLNAARDKLVATQTAVEDLLSGIDTESAEYAADEGSGHGDCPGGHRGGRPGPPEDSDSDAGSETSS